MAETTGMPWEQGAAGGMPWEQGPPQAEEPSTTWDVTKSLGRGVVKGAAGLVGLPGTVSELMHQGGEWAGNKLGLPPQPLGAQKGSPGLPSGADIEHGIEKVAGKFEQPKTTSGKFAESVGEMLPGGMIGPGGMVTKGLASITGGIGAEAAAEQFPEHENLARFVGGVLGFATPRAISRGITLNPNEAGRQAAVDLLQQEGITAATAGQRTGRESIKYAESLLGDSLGAGGQATAARNEVGTQLTRALLRRAGIAADRATADVVDGAFHRIGGDLDALAARNPAQFDAQFLHDLYAARDEYHNVVQHGNRRETIDNFINDITDRLARSGTLDGEQYQRFRSRLTRQQRNAFADPEFSQALGGVIEAMDDLMLRSMRAANSPDIGMWEMARRQYRNLIPLARASTGGGEGAASGILTPGQMRQALTSSQRGQRDYARGRGDFAELVRAANEVLAPLPNSGTGQRAVVQGITSGLGAAGSTLLGTGPTEGGAAALAGAMAPGMAGRAIMSRPAQAYMGNQLMTDVIPQTPGIRQSAGASAAALGARQAPDGRYYVEDPDRRGKYFRVEETAEGLPFAQVQ